MLYSVILVSAIQQSESAICIYMHDYTIVKLWFVYQSCMDVRVGP